MTDEQHLYCTECEARVGVARLDRVAHLVCHCTHVDGDLRPVTLKGPGVMVRQRDRWEYRPHGGRDTDKEN